MPDEFIGYLVFYILIALAGLAYQEKELLCSKIKEVKERRAAKKNKDKKGDGEITEEGKDQDDEEKPLLKDGSKKDKKKR